MEILRGRISNQDDVVNILSGRCSTVYRNNTPVELHIYNIILQYPAAQCRSDLFTSNLRSDHLLRNSAFYSQIVFHILLVIYKQLHQFSNDIHNVICKNSGSIFLGILCYIRNQIPLYCRLFFKTQNTRKSET
jgi:hypothetical protein